MTEKSPSESPTPPPLITIEQTPASDVLNAEVPTKEEWKQQSNTQTNPSQTTEQSNPTSITPQTITEQQQQQQQQQIEQQQELSGTPPITSSSSSSTPSKDNARSRRRRAMVINFEDVQKLITEAGLGENVFSPNKTENQQISSQDELLGAEGGFDEEYPLPPPSQQQQSTFAPSTTATTTILTAIGTTTNLNTNSNIDTEDLVGIPPPPTTIALPPPPKTAPPRAPILPPHPTTAAPLPPPSQQQQQQQQQQMSESEHAEMHYRAFLSMALREDFTDLDKFEFLYRSGYDKEGRTILVLIGCNLPAKKVQLERLFLYTLKTLDPIVEREYVLVYVAGLCFEKKINTFKIQHYSIILTLIFYLYIVVVITANQSSENRPSFTWLRRVYTLFNRKYKKNLKRLYVVRPTAWLKMVLGLFRPFVSHKFWAKLIYVPTVMGIFDSLSPQQLHFPASFMEKVMAMKPIFGETLEHALLNPMNLGQDVPIVISQCLRFLYDKALDLEGILRVPGDRSQMNEYRLAFDAGKPIDFFTSCDDPHTVGSLMKLYLRELPEPLLTFNLFDPLIHAQLDPGFTQNERLKKLESLLNQLPKANKVVLWHVISFAAELPRHKDKNKMTVENVAVCLAPTLMWRRPEEIDPTQALQELAYVNTIVKLMIDHREILPVDFQS